MKVTADVPVKFVPLTVTVCPPFKHKLGVGEKLLIVGVTGTNTFTLSTPISSFPKSEVAINLSTTVEEIEDDKLDTV